jgi:hypothetical protein
MPEACNFIKKSSLSWLTVLKIQGQGAASGGDGFLLAVLRRYRASHGKKWGMSKFVLWSCSLFL